MKRRAGGSVDVGNTRRVFADDNEIDFFELRCTHFCPECPPATVLWQHSEDNVKHKPYDTIRDAILTCARKPT